VELALPLLLFFPRQCVALEIKRDLLQAECGRPEQSIKLAALVFLVLHDEGVLLTEIRFAKIRSRQYHALEPKFASHVRLRTLAEANQLRQSIMNSTLKEKNA
jgi:hypothetical protein